ncbi:phosphosulfolactate synthase [Methanobacterium alcaliphilum]|uniref:phosphosulfolactate synthase n=1 Tax=Methanobacterium alcaliphilum TaxID=392018 RepID=UPI00200A089B|nr:phosphosulfolactate synthase [Methanobacterium alcaliphilum]
MNAFNFLTPERLDKPRDNGITMVLDKGLGLKTAESLMQISGPYLDFMKFGWGTIALHERSLIKEKIKMYRSYDVNAYPGGTLFEIAYLQNKIPAFFEEAEKLGFETLEISDGSTSMTMQEKLDFISQGNDRGFKIISEVGKKDPVEDHKLDLQTRVNLIEMELDAGSEKVLIEAREGGQNIGIFDEKGGIKEGEVDYLMDSIPSEKLIWEAPKKNQQVYFILKIGTNVNLGNIPPEEITSLETMRRGLRGDTLGKVNI